MLTITFILKDQRHSVICIIKVVNNIIVFHNFNALIIDWNIGLGHCLMTWPYESQAKNSYNIFIGLALHVVQLGFLQATKLLVCGHTTRRDAFIQSTCLSSLVLTFAHENKLPHVLLVFLTRKATGERRLCPFLPILDSTPPLSCLMNQTRCIVQNLAIEISYL